MSIFLLTFLRAAAGIASMTAAVERGDLDEAARQGALAGPTVVERALKSKVRSTVLAGIVAAPTVEDRAEVLATLAEVAAGSDRRTAIPAARAARTIARALARKDLADDLAPDDIEQWRARFEQIAVSRTLIEVRIAALETANALEHVLDPDQLGFALGRALGQADPALRVAALGLVDRAPVADRAAIVAAVADPDVAVAIAAAQALCADDDLVAIKTALGDAGIGKIRALVKAHATEIRDAARCLN